MEFNINVDAKELDSFIKRYASKAVEEYSQAIKETAIYGLQTIKANTPVKTGTAKNSWKFILKNKLLAGISSDNNYIKSLDQGWSRNKPILPIRAKVLVFQIAKFTAAKSATTTLYKRYAKAIKSLKGKGLSPQDKAKYATEKTGVVITNKVSAPAKYKGANFIAGSVLMIEKKLINNVEKAMQRLTA